MSAAGNLASNASLMVSLDSRLNPSVDASPLLRVDLPDPGGPDTTTNSAVGSAAPSGVEADPVLTTELWLGQAP